jgi:hypothetical protein
LEFCIRLSISQTLLGYTNSLFFLLKINSRLLYTKILQTKNLLLNLLNCEPRNLNYLVDSVPRFSSVHFRFNEPWTEPEHEPQILQIIEPELNWTLNLWTWTEPELKVLVHLGSVQSSWTCSKFINMFRFSSSSVTKYSKIFLSLKFSNLEFFKKIFFLF